MLSIDWTVWLTGVASLAAFFVSALNCGAVLAHLFGLWPYSSLRLSLTLCFGVASVALAGLAVWLLPGWPRGLAIAALGFINTAAILLSWRWKHHPLQDLSPRQYLMLGSWATLSLVLFLLVTVDFPLPTPIQPGATVLPDGPYVFKQWTLPVRIQYLVGDYPADNALPAYAAEYMVRRISFADVRPLMPGQEVADRPLLMAWMGLPFRALFGGEFTSVPSTEVPRINYVGSSWPNVGALISDRAFASTLAPFIAANAALMIGIFEAIELFGIAGSVSLALIFTAASSYFLIHTVFTWPKNLAGLFLVTAYLVATSKRPLWLALALAGLAYLAHPYALAFVGGYVLLHIAEKVRTRRLENKPAAPQRYWAWVGPLLPPFCMIGAWELWTRGVLHMSSNLIAQNVGGKAGLFALWPRIANFAQLWLPVAFTQYDSTLKALVRTLNIELVSAIGWAAWLILPAALIHLLNKRDFNAAVLTLVVLLPTLATTLVFGSRAVPLMHGWQAAAPVLLVVALQFGQGVYGSWFPKAAGMAQVAFFVPMLWGYVEELLTRWS